MVCKIESLVSESVAMLDQNASVQDAAVLMAKEQVGSLVVSSEDGIVGMFTERDLLHRVVGASLDPQTLRLGEVCSRDLITISADSDCHQAVLKMRSNGCRRLLVYRGRDFTGMVNLTDVANAMAEQRRGRNLLVNLVGGVTLTLAVGVIAMLAYQLPQMLELAQRVSGY
jgi:signal-transduction protein with cAMP-binding, CBS, and nucleotidyltransferase domain